MITFISQYWSEVLLAVITAGALGFFRGMLKELKTYKQMLEEKNIEALDIRIEEAVAPILEEIEKLRSYIYTVDTAEKEKMSLIIDSYKFRLVQLCKLYIRQGYMTQGQFDQLSEFFKLYTHLGGNGQAKEYYERAILLPIKDGVDV